VDLLECIGALLACGRPDRAAKLLEERFGREVLRTHALDNDVLRLAARVSLEHGDLRGGRALARRMLANDPKCVAAIHNLALIALTRGRLGPAWQWITRGRAIDPGDIGLKKLRSLWLWKRVTHW
jgi:hypothetical protein